MWMCTTRRHVLCSHVDVLSFTKNFSNYVILNYSIYSEQDTGEVWVPAYLYRATGLQPSGAGMGFKNSGKGTRDEDKFEGFFQTKTQCALNSWVRPRSTPLLPICVTTSHCSECTKGSSLWRTLILSPHWFEGIIDTSSTRWWADWLRPVTTCSSNISDHDFPNASFRIK